MPLRARAVPCSLLVAQGRGADLRRHRGEPGLDPLGDGLGITADVGASPEIADHLGERLLGRLAGGEPTFGAPATGSRVATDMGGTLTGSGSRADSVRGAGALDVVIGPPEIDSSAARGTRRSRPNATTGSPWRPSVSRQTRASSYAAVRPLRKTLAASSTVRKSGWSGAVGGIGDPAVSSRTNTDTKHLGRPETNN